MSKSDVVRDELRMTPEQKRKVDLLSEADIKEIDHNVENASAEWSKASRIVLTTMIEREEGVTGLPELFFFERIKSLVKDGVLESKGDLSNMKSSEIRLSAKK